MAILLGVAEQISSTFRLPALLALGKIAGTRGPA